MRIYTYQPGALAEVIKSWTDAIPHREQYSPLAAAMYSELGGLNTWVHIWPYKDLNERNRIRAEATQDPHWSPSPSTRHLLMKQENKVLVPVAFSPMHERNGRVWYGPKTRWAVVPGEVANHSWVNNQRPPAWCPGSLCSGDAGFGWPREPYEGLLGYERSCGGRVKDGYHRLPATQRLAPHRRVEIRPAPFSCRFALCRLLQPLSLRVHYRQRCGKIVFEIPVRPSRQFLRCQGLRLTMSLARLTFW